MCPRRDALRFAPVFVLAPARSFTSVVTAMIGQHPELAGLPELKLFAYQTVGELMASLPRYWRERGIVHRSPGLVRAVAELEFGDQTPDRLAQAQRWLEVRAHWSGAATLDALLARLSPRAAVEKSPENAASDAALRRLDRAYPRARYLHLARHPVTTQASMAAHRRRTVPGHPLEGEPMTGVAAWIDVHLRILSFAAALPPDRLFRVRAEDLLNRPQAQLKAIAQWLEVRTDAAAIEAMRHPEASPFARPGPAGSGLLGGNDPDFQCDPIPHAVMMPATLVPPESWRGEEELWQAAAKLARHLGYGAEVRD